MTNSPFFAKTIKKAVKIIREVFDLYQPEQNFQSLSDKEIKKLPLELKVCYLLMEWGKDFQPAGVQQWAYGIGYLAFDGEDAEERAKNAMKEVRRVLFFLYDYVLD